MDQWSSGKVCWRHKCKGACLLEDPYDKSNVCSACVGLGVPVGRQGAWGKFRELRQLGWGVGDALWSKQGGGRSQGMRNFELNLSHLKKKSLQKPGDLIKAVFLEWFFGNGIQGLLEQERDLKLGVRLESDTATQSGGALCGRVVVEIELVKNKAFNETLACAGNVSSHNKRWY